MESRSIKWINCTKFAAIIAVTMKHINASSAIGNALSVLSIFSVSAFVFLGGMTTLVSLEKRFLAGESIWNHSLHRAISLLKAYLPAVFLCYIVFQEFFRLSDFATYFIEFPYVFYFVAFYCQLILISPLLFLIIRKMRTFRIKGLLFVLFLVVSFYLSFLFTERTFIFNSYSGARYLLGGSFFLIFCTGMVCGSIQGRQKTRMQLIVITLISFTICFFWAKRFLLDYTDDSPFYTGWGLNPPGFYVMVYTFFILLFFYSIFSLCERNEKLLWLVNSCNFLGKNTLVIFLYQIPIIEILQRSSVIMRLKGPIRYPLILFIACTVPLLGDFFFRKIKVWLLEK